MAIQTEIWVKAIIEGLFADNTFAGQSIDHSMFVNNRTVHVPNAGSPPNIEKNRTTKPAAVTERQDIDLHYDIDEYTSDPIVVPEADKVELSFNKRESVISTSRRKLHDVIYGAMIYNWIPAGVTVVKTDGAAVPSHLPAATGNRKAMTRKTVEKLQTLFDSQDIPLDGRNILLDAQMYNELMNDMTDAQKVAFIAGADPAKGTIGEFLGFHFYKRSRVAKADNSGTPKPWSAVGAATDNAAGLAWHADCVSRALGNAKVFYNEDDATWYGDIISVLQRAGGSAIRSDKAGVALIMQDAA